MGVYRNGILLRSTVMDQCGFDSLLSRFFKKYDYKFESLTLTYDSNILNPLMVESLRNKVRVE